MIELQALSPATLLKRDSNPGAFLRNCEIFKNSFLYRAPLVTASVVCRIHNLGNSIHIRKLIFVTVAWKETNGKWCSYFPYSDN